MIDGDGHGTKLSWPVLKKTFRNLPWKTEYNHCICQTLVLWVQQLNQRPIRILNGGFIPSTTTVKDN